MKILRLFDMLLTPRNLKISQDMLESDVLTLSDEDDDNKMEEFVVNDDENEDETGSKEGDVIDDDEDDEVFEMEAVTDVRVNGRRLEFKVKWVGYEEETWQVEADFVGPQSKEMVDEFKAANAEKIEKLLESKRKTRQKRKPYYEYQEVESEDEKDETEPLKPRELTEEDRFYGEDVTELRGEARRLFDPSHRQTETDLLLNQLASKDTPRLSRSSVRALVTQEQSPRTSRESTVVTPPAKKGRGKKRAENMKDSPEHQPKKRGRKKKSEEKTVAPKKGRGRKKQIESDTEDFTQDVEETIKKEEQAMEEMDTNGAEPRRGRRGRKPLVDMAEEEVDVSRTRKRVVMDADDFDGEDDPEPAPVVVDRVQDPDWEEDEAVAAVQNLSVGPSGSSTDPEYSFVQWMERVEKKKQEVNRLPPNTIVYPHSLADPILAGDVRRTHLILNRMEEKDPYPDFCYKWSEPKTQKSLLHKVIEKCAVEDSSLSSKQNSYKIMVDILLRICGPRLLYIPDIHGNLAVHEAVMARNSQVLMSLIFGESPMCIKNRDQKTPLDLAMERGDVKIIQILLCRGCSYHHLLNPNLPLRKSLLKRENGKKLFDLIFEHSTNLGSELSRIRRALLPPEIREIRTETPISIIPKNHGEDVFYMDLFWRSDGPANEQQGFLLFLIPITYCTTANRWVAEMTLKLSAQPLMNDCKLQPSIHSEYATSFFAHPRHGNNIIKIEQKNPRIVTALTAQLIRYELSDPMAPAPQQAQEPSFRRPVPRNR